MEIMHSVRIYQSPPCFEFCGKERRSRSFRLKEKVPWRNGFQLVASRRRDCCAAQAHVSLVQSKLVMTPRKISLLALVRAMESHINHPDVAVPVELFESAMSRAGIDLSDSKSVASLSSKKIKLIAKITEEVRLRFIDVMNVHTQEAVNLPLPQMPSGVAGVPPPIRFESKATAFLRTGGVPSCENSAAGSDDFDKPACLENFHFSTKK